MQHLLAYFSNEKNKPIKRTEQFISPIKNLCEKVIEHAISVPDQRVFILLTMIFLSKKLFKKILYYFN